MKIKTTKHNTLKTKKTLNNQQSVNHLKIINTKKILNHTHHTLTTDIDLIMVDSNTNELSANTKRDYLNMK